jgi:cephalosporin hydroxylase
MEPQKDDGLKILEIGIFKGESMEAFHEYFPNGDIYGIDIFTRQKPHQLDILKEERCHWIKADSTNPAVGPQLHEAFGAVKFDIIIDDGMHNPKANMMTMNNMVPFLADGGSYFIEDVFPLEKMTQEQLNHPWLLRNPQHYNAMDNNMFLNAIDKTGLKVERYDLRATTGEPDSYIIRLYK